MNFFITGKHWQIFLLLFVLPFAVFFVLMMGIMVKMTITMEAYAGAEPDPMVVFRYMPWMFAILAPIQWLHYAWFGSLEKFFTSQLPSHLQFSRGFFKFSHLYGPVVFTLFIGALFFFFYSIPQSDNPEAFMESILEASPFLYFMVLLYALIMFSAVTQIYVVYYVSRAKRCAELQKQAPFSEFFKEIILFGFFPWIGVFILQPEINDMAEGKHLNREPGPSFEYQN